MTRVANCVNGINSFMDKYNGMNVWRSIGVVKRIFLSPEREPIFKTEGLEFTESIDQIVTVHLAIQGPDQAI